MTVKNSWKFKIKYKLSDIFDDPALQIIQVFGLDDD
jgi:hypothetical protein